MLHPPAASPHACPLCDLVRSAIPSAAAPSHVAAGAHRDGDAAHVICELDHSLVILSENQGCPGWCVLVLKDHAEHLAELPLVRQECLFREAARVAQAIRDEFSSASSSPPPRINYECLGNLVPHVHWHVIPRHADDPDPARPVWGREPSDLRGSMTSESRRALASRLRARLLARDTANRAAVFRFADMGFDSPMALLQRRRVMGERVMLSHVTLERGFVLQTHAHENEQLSVIVSGKMRFGLGAPGAPDSRDVILSAGEALHLPSWTPHSALALERTEILDIFSPVSASTGVDAHRS